jgi:hypothetical protein
VQISTLKKGRYSERPERARQTWTREWSGDHWCWERRCKWRWRVNRSWPSWKPDSCLKRNEEKERLNEIPKALEKLAVDHW